MKGLVKSLKSIFPIIAEEDFSEYVRYDILMTSEEKSEFKKIYYNIFRLLGKIDTIHKGGAPIKSLKELKLDDLMDRIKKILYDGLECIKSIKDDYISSITLSRLKNFEVVLKYINKNPELIYNESFSIEDDKDLLDLINYEIMRNTPAKSSKSYELYQSYKKQQIQLIKLIRIYNLL